jgi:hypothetical protein
MTEDKSFVDLVLERMDTNPDEFIEGSPKFRWESLVHSLRPHQGPTISAHTQVLWALTEDEIKALSTKYVYVYREFLRREFIKNIMDEPNTLRPRLGSGQNYVNKKPSSILAPSTMRAEAERVLRQAIDKEAQEGNWGAVSAINTMGRNLP